MDKNSGIFSSEPNACPADPSHDPSLISHPTDEWPEGAQASYSATIITPMDSVLVAAAETTSRAPYMSHGAGSGFGERLSHLGSSISHMISDLTGNLSAGAHDALDSITHTAHDLSDAVASADYKAMVDDTRRTIGKRPERNIAVAAAVGLALGLIASKRRF